MPFKSKAQRKFMFSQHPEIAKRWAKEYPESAHSTKLPEHVESMRHMGERLKQEAHAKRGKKK